VSLLKAELGHVSKDAGTQEAKVELNLTPRLMKADSGASLPAYQVSALHRLSIKALGDCSLMIY
jgi:hypothetical protein